MNVQIHVPNAIRRYARPRVDAATLLASHLRAAVAVVLALAVVAYLTLGGAVQYLYVAAY